MANSAYVGLQRISDQASDFSATSAIVRRIIAGMGGPTIVQVVKVDSGTGLNPVGFVDIQILVQQQTGDGKVSSHGTIHNVPYCRIQGGKRAFIIDPEVGDLGLAVICNRDISNVKTAKAEAPPGSFGVFQHSDAIYLGGLLNGTPAEYCGWVDGDFHIKSAGKVIIDATSVSINCDMQTQNISATGDVTATGDVKADSISLTTHTHPVTNAPGTTGTPQ